MLIPTIIMYVCTACTMSATHYIMYACAYLGPTSPAGTSQKLISTLKVVQDLLSRMVRTAQ